MNTTTTTIPERRSEAGASIIVAIFFAAAIGLMVSSFLLLTNSEYKMSTRALLSNSSLNLAEAGAEEALWALNNNDWSTWTEAGNYVSKKVSNFDLGSGRSGNFSVVVEDYATTPSVYVEGRVQTPTGIESYRQLKIELTGRSLFPNGMVAITQLTLGGNGGDTDGDGIEDSLDKDKDGDGIDDKDDNDDDGDGIPDDVEKDSDSDGFSDAADDDDDGNGINDDLETDSDGDGMMDFDDDDDDNDGIADSDDDDDDGNGIPDNDENDSDNDGCVDSMDKDDDNDGIDDEFDDDDDNDGDKDKDDDDDSGESGIQSGCAEAAASGGSSNMKLDSYDSSAGAYDSFLNRSDNISVASPSAAAGSVDISNAEVYGYVATGGGAPAMGSSAKVQGADTPPGTDVDPNRVASDFTSDFPDIPPPSLSSPSTSLPEPDESGVITIGTGALPGTPEEYHLESLELSDGNSLVIDGPIVLVIDGQLKTNDLTEIRVNSNASASAALYVGGETEIKGAGFVNDSLDPSKFVFYSTSTLTSNKIKIEGSADMHIAIYAPKSLLEIGGSSEYFGSIVGNIISMSGDNDFHYDEQLANFFSDSASTTYGMKTWRELVQNTDQVDFDSYLNP